MWVRACLWFGRVAVAFVSALVEEVQCVQDIKAFKTWFLKLGLQMATILCTSLVAGRGERKALNLVVVGSSPTVGAAFALFGSQTYIPLTHNPHFLKH
ncbi:hypothetical protein AeRB84_009348, partial [Aphanomyces euteiches]